ncbi:MAG TPA: sulfate adenylyltransferase subunit CysD [Gordonia sp. (in: high G+C Gram-positive bacteria)]|uniref:sulfate adenylyltransferase subunit CysD n=1 Tax=unclassified Gordonia (in: high G+C Gram-positive bacteria) TaxID=2657482 RepID=UPI000FBEEFF3|nr:MULTISPECIES: sulfate adenylyltransferase subunit CysD [unclassified Gordonia (in: high G+C Gram-positive bacteria)]RUP37566.1 MAG: sulfate adenylyltransferase subunit CysD [Gordonia sp. (in: high G+C Gram-positive bacteria)]HNP56512.1 sulfate adenylyltransferase subunit CysD [Gordonia sp. (in: high G+C Gram-positive bacteria)]HRC50635.1 sulfate adenylyltransferase subunit CysD [Gordonia sp. (in: high G+C Gram-positive bacteria)]
MTAQTTSPATDIDHIPALRILESEAVHIIREVVAELENPVLLFSGGKDSIVLLHLAEKAFRPHPLPFPILHVDTGHNFSEVIAFRDKRVTPTAQRPDGVRLIVASVQESIDTGRVEETTDPSGSRNRLQTRTLLDALERYKFDAAFGGARRDEDRARAKERVFSFRDEFGQWDPRAQRAEPWSLYNGRIRRGESVRVFPLSNWTELDIWRYIELEDIELPPIYFASQRDVFTRDGILLTVSPFTHPRPDEPVTTEWVRYRTVGDLTITGAVRSTATTLPEVIAEVEEATVSERGETRADDRTSSAAMEDRKREGYF